MRALVLCALLIGACRAPRQQPPPAESPPAVAEATSAIADVLAREAGEPVVLVDRAGAIVATTPSGAWARELAAGPTRRARYDAAIRMLWFLRGDRLIAVDLARPQLDEVEIATAVPDLSLVIGPGAYLENEECPLGCVSIRATATPAAAVVMPQIIAPGTTTPAPPRFTAAAAPLFARLPAPRPPSRGYAALTPSRAPLPSSASQSPTCSYDTCGRVFEGVMRGRSLLVVGRTCDCKPRDGGCSALCVWVDARWRFASMRDPGRWRSDAAGEPACHPAFAPSGDAYAVGDWISPGPLAVCTAAGCRAESGRFLGWLETGYSTDETMEDDSNCEH